MPFSGSWSICVFLQFFTRYAMNNSLAWTEEIATNTLIVVVFLGAAMCVRTTRHIHVDVLYHYLPERVGALTVKACRRHSRHLLRLRDLADVALRLDCRHERMTTINLPRSWFFYLVFVGFVLMFLRSIQVLVENWRRGYSVLEHPEKFDAPGA